MSAKHLQGMFLYIVFLMFTSSMAYAKHQHTIFVLHSYSQEYAWTKGQHDAFIRGLETAGLSARYVAVEYLDTKRTVFDEAYQEKFLVYLLNKYHNFSPDLIYATDDHALDFLRKYKTNLFVESPVVFSGVNNLLLLRELDRHYFTGVFEQKTVANNLRLISSFYPETKDIWFIGDDSHTYQAIKRELLKELTSFSDIAPHFIASADIKDVTDELASLQPSNILLTTVGGFSENGELLSIESALDAIIHTGDHRLFSMEDAYIHPGIIGGYVTSSLMQGKHASTLAQKILQGTAVSDLPAVTKSPNRYMFNRQALKAKSLSLPTDIEQKAMIVNEDPGFYIANRALILGALFTLGTTIFLVLLFFLLSMRHKNRLIQAQTQSLQCHSSELEKTKESLNKAQRIASLGNWDWDIVNNTLEWSEGIYHIFKIDPKEFEASYEAFMERVHPDDRSLVQAAVEDAITAKEPYDIFHRIVLRDGTSRIVHEQGEVMFDDNAPVRMIGTVQDVTEQKEAEERLEQLANYDPLTGLPNRHFLNRHLQQGMNRAIRGHNHLALLFLDLDNFKTVNDTLGHNIGDLLLIDVAKRLKSQLRSSDTVIRMGGDEFIIILEQIDNPSEIAGICEKILNLFANPFHLESHDVYTTTSIGISVYPDDGSDTQTLIKHADTAMYTSKEEGKNKFHFFTQKMNAEALSRLMIENSLRKAIDNNELELVFQPQYTIDTKELIGAEALLRWKQPDFGYIPPSEFIPIAEDSGLITDIGEWVIETALIHLRRWCDASLNPVTIAVNISSRQLKNRQLAPLLQELSLKHEVIPSMLAVELTESSLMASSSDIITQFKEIQRLGIEIAIDDFGTGYSSLSYLKKLPINKLKIDRSFVQDIEDDADDRILTKTIITMAKNLNLDIIAEGVETEGQRTFLMEHGCPSVQGFLFSKPLSATAFESLLRTRANAGETTV